MTLFWKILVCVLWLPTICVMFVDYLLEGMMVYCVIRAGWLE